MKFLQQSERYNYQQSFSAALNSGKHKLNDYFTLMAPIYYSIIPTTNNHPRCFLKMYPLVLFNINIYILVYSIMIIKILEYPGCTFWLIIFYAYLLDYHQNARPVTCMFIMCRKLYPQNIIIFFPICLILTQIYIFN